MTWRRPFAVGSLLALAATLCLLEDEPARANGTTSQTRPLSRDWTVRGDTPQASDVDSLEAQLSGIDFLPDRDRLDELATGSAVRDLVDLSQDETALAGRRLRALRSLAAYPAEPAEVALRNAVERYGSSDEGMDLVYLRAAAEGLAQVGGEAAGPTLRALLGHPSPDVRAAAARGVGEVGDTAAIGELFRQLDVEKVPFVRAAIERALADLR